MSNKENDNYEENLVSRAEAVMEYFTSKPPGQIVENLLKRAKKSGSNDDWERLEAYVRECEGVIFQNEYNPKEAESEQPDVY